MGSISVCDDDADDNYQHIYNLSRGVLIIIISHYLMVVQTVHPSIILWKCSLSLFSIHPIQHARKFSLVGVRLVVSKVYIMEYDYALYPK